MFSTVLVYFVDRGHDVDSLVMCGPSDGVNEAPPIVILYSVKFLRGAKFCVFRGYVGCRENKNREILNGRRNDDIIACERYGIGTSLVWWCSRSIDRSSDSERIGSIDVKIKTTKSSSKRLTSNSTKICTSKNFPLYGSKSNQAYNGISNRLQLSMSRMSSC